VLFCRSFFLLVKGASLSEAPFTFCTAIVSVARLAGGFALQLKTIRIRNLHRSRQYQLRAEL
jgi:hypothetical protein